MRRIVPEKAMLPRVRSSQLLVTSDAYADLLVLECNGRHPHKSHMDMEAVRALHARHPGTRLVLTHLGDDVGAADFDETVTVPDDFDTVTADPRQRSAPPAT